MTAGPQRGPRVLLVGMMGAGKTTVGRAIAEQAGWRYLDNDELVRLATGQATPEVLDAADEPTLRRIEAAALDAALEASPPVVASAAAGVVLDPAARQRMQDNAFVVFLRASLATLVARVGDGRGRPWLTVDPAASLAHLYEGREPLYCEVADLVLDVDGADASALAASIISAVGAIDETASIDPATRGSERGPEQLRERGADP